MVNTPLKKQCSRPNSVRFFSGESAIKEFEDLKHSLEFLVRCQQLAKDQLINLLQQVGAFVKKGVNRIW